MREHRTSGSMRRGEKRVMVHSANGHRTRKGGNGGAPPDLYTTASPFTLLNAPVEAPDRSSECGVGTSDAQTAKRRGSVAIVTPGGGIDA
jgi:hypothetical protein